MVARPKIEWRGGQVIGDRIGVAVARQVDGLDMRLGSVATFQADVVEVGGVVDRKLPIIFFSAAYANDAAELPFGKAEAADQRSCGAIAHLPQDGHGGAAIAERTKGTRGVTLKNRGAGTLQLSVGLKESPSEKALGIGGR